MSASSVTAPGSQLSLHNRSLFKTGCPHRTLRNDRSIPDVGIGGLDVGNVAAISMIATTAPGQKWACGKSAQDSMSELECLRECGLLWTSAAGQCSGEDNHQRPSLIITSNQRFALRR